MRIYSRMRRFYFLQIVFLFFGMTLLVGRKQEYTGFPLSVAYTENGINQVIHGFESEGSLYFCLPGYAEPEKFSIQLKGRRRCLTEDGQVWKNGDSLADVVLDQAYHIQFEEGASAEAYEVIFLRGSEIPAIFLTTASGSLDYVHAQKGNQERGYLQILKENGEQDCSVALKRISGRGNTSWDAVKKSYTLKLDEAEDILGMGASKTWLLIANYYDGAYIRNQIGFEMARKGGILYTPDERFADLYVNGEYRGLYQIMEKLEAGENRMEIGNSSLLELDQREKVGDEEYIMLSNDQPVVIHDPASGEELELVKRFFDSFCADMEEGEVPFERLDMDSFAKDFVLEEILQDLDFGATSHYMYLDLENEMLYDGPPWDLDNTMGRGGAQEAESYFTTTYKLSSNNLTRWYARLITEKQFYQEVSGQYQENFRSALAQMVETGIDERIAVIRSSIRMDQRRYPGPHSTFMPDASLDENVAYLKNYLAEKMAVMDAVFDGNEAHMPQKEPLPELQRSEF